MKKMRILGFALLLMLAFSAVVSAGSQDFTLVNQTGSNIHYVFVSPHSSSDWGSDIMGRDSLPNGNAVKVQFAPNTSVATWDIRVEYDDGSYEEWVNFDLNTISQITLRPNGDAEYQ